MVETKRILQTEKDPLVSSPPLSSSTRVSFKRRRNPPEPSAGAEFSQGLQLTLFQFPSQLIPQGSEKAQPTAALCNQQPRCGWDSGLQQLPLSSPRAYGLHFTLELYSSNIPVLISDRPHPNHHPPPAAPENTWRLRMTSPALPYYAVPPMGVALPSLGLNSYVLHLELLVLY